jgi:hypothetical protein
MHKVEPSGVVLHGVCDIQTDIAARPKPVGPLPPCGGRLAGRKSMYAGRVSKTRCAVASGWSRGQDSGSPSEAQAGGRND